SSRGWGGNAPALGLSLGLSFGVSSAAPRLTASVRASKLARPNIFCIAVPSPESQEDAGYLVVFYARNRFWTSVQVAVLALSAAGVLAEPLMPGRQGRPRRSQACLAPERGLCQRRVLLCRGEQGVQLDLQAVRLDPQQVEVEQGVDVGPQQQPVLGIVV